MPECPSLEAVTGPRKLQGSAVAEELRRRDLPLVDRVKGGAVDTAVVVGVEALGLLLAPFTFALSSVLSSLLTATYVACKDMPGVGVGQRLAGGRVLDGSGGAASLARVVGRNAPLSMALLLGALPDPLGLAGLFLASMVLLAEVVLMMLTGRRLGDLVAGTRVTDNGDLTS